MRTLCASKFRPAPRLNLCVKAIRKEEIVITCIQQTRAGGWPHPENPKDVASKFENREKDLHHAREPKGPQHSKQYSIKKSVTRTVPSTCCTKSLALSRLFLDIFQIFREDAGCSPVLSRHSDLMDGVIIMKSVLPNLLDLHTYIRGSCFLCFPTIRFCLFLVVFKIQALTHTTIWHLAPASVLVGRAVDALLDKE